MGREPPKIHTRKTKKKKRGARDRRGGLQDNDKKVIANSTCSQDGAKLMHVVTYTSCFFPLLPVFLKEAGKRGGLVLQRD